MALKPTPAQLDKDRGLEPTLDPQIAEMRSGFGNRLLSAITWVDDAFEATSVRIGGAIEDGFRAFVKHLFYGKNDKKSKAE